MVSKSKTYCIDYFLIKIFVSLVKFLNIILDEYTFSQSYTSFFLIIKASEQKRLYWCFFPGYHYKFFDTANIQLCKFRFKGYLCYKTITSKNVLAEARIKNFKQVRNFVSQKSYVTFSRYSSFCIFNHPIFLSNLQHQGAFLNIYFESQLINPSNLVN